MSSSISPQVRSIDGIQIRYAETAVSDCPTLLLLNPWPESLYALGGALATTLGARATGHSRPSWIRAVGSSRGPLLPARDGTLRRPAHR
jgi:hypothetical protein